MLWGTHRDIYRKVGEVMLGKKHRVHFIQLPEPLPDTKVGDRTVLCGAEIPRATLVPAFDDMPVGTSMKVEGNSGLFCDVCWRLAAAAAITAPLGEIFVYAVHSAQEEANETAQEG